MMKTTEEYIEKKIMEEEYDSFIEDEDVANDNTSTDRFVVDDSVKCDWCFRKIKQLEDEKQKMEEYIKNQIEKYNQFKDKETERLNREITHFEILIEQFVLQETEKNDKFRVRTLNGMASMGKEITKLQYDVNQVIEICKERNLTNCIKIETKEKLDKKTFEKSLTITDDDIIVDENGEIIDNITVDRARKCNIKLNK